MFYSLQNHPYTPANNQADAWQSDPLFLKWPASYSDHVKVISPENWELEIDGLVKKPSRFQYKDLLGFTRIMQNRRLVFADGYSVRATWEGFVMQELLHRVQPEPEALYLKQTNLAGQSECIPLKALYDQRALFCMRVNGKALPSLYGGPLRLLVFDRYAHKGLGQITRLELVKEPSNNFYESKGYDQESSIVPGQYYACDLSEMRQINASAEVTDW